MISGTKGDDGRDVVAAPAGPDPEAENKLIREFVARFTAGAEDSFDDEEDGEEMRSLLGDNVRTLRAQAHTAGWYDGNRYATKELQSQLETAQQEVERLRKSLEQNSDEGSQLSAAQEELLRSEKAETARATQWAMRERDRADLAERSLADLREAAEQADKMLMDAHPEHIVRTIYKVHEVLLPAIEASR